MEDDKEIEVMKEEIRKVEMVNDDMSVKMVRNKCMKQ